LLIFLEKASGLEKSVIYFDGSEAGARKGSEPEQKNVAWQHCKKKGWRGLCDCLFNCDRIRLPDLGAGSFSPT
jgi:hypothetical protein